MKDIDKKKRIKGFYYVVCNYAINGGESYGTHAFDSRINDPLTLVEALDFWNEHTIKDMGEKYNGEATSVISNFIKL